MNCRPLNSHDLVVCHIILACHHFNTQCCFSFASLLAMNIIKYAMHLIIKRQSWRPSSTKYQLMDRLWKMGLWLRGHERYCIIIAQLGQAKLISCSSSAPAPYFRHLLQLSLLPSNLRHTHLIDLLPCRCDFAHAHSFNMSENVWWETSLSGQANSTCIAILIVSFRLVMRSQE